MGKYCSLVFIKLNDQMSYFYYCLHPKISEIYAVRNIPKFVALCYKVNNISTR